MRYQRFACARLSHSHMTWSKCHAVYHDVHHRGCSAVAAHGSLKSPPTGRPRRVHLHLSYSTPLVTASCHNAPFPLSSPARFSSSIRKPGWDSRCLNTGHRMARKQVSAMLYPGAETLPGFDVIWWISMRRQQFAFARLSHPHMTWSNATPFNRNVHHRGFWPKQLPAVWSLPLQGGFEGSPFIFRTAWRFTPSWHNVSASPASSE